MKKRAVIAIVFGIIAAGTVMAGPPPPHPGGGHHHHWNHGNDGVRLAADIVGLVGAGMNILRGPQQVVVTQPAVVTAPVAVAAQPVIVQQPVCVQYYTPPPRHPHHHR